jgi:hypothetical protein
MTAVNSIDVAYWLALDMDADGKVDSLFLSFDATNTLTIRNYFSDTATTAAGSSAGAGLIEYLSFSDGTLQFSDVVALI